MGRQEWERAVAFEALEQGRNRALPQLPIFPDARHAGDDRGLSRTSHPAVPRARRPAHRARPACATIAISCCRRISRRWRSSGVTDDLTGPTRLAEDGVSYIREPRADLPYFYLSTARDPRPIIVHEGVPGHYLQLALSWAHENPIRRHYYDSGANEGLGFYAEEMMLQAGLWDESPRSREIIYNFARLRALRVEVDVKLATGVFTIPAGGRLPRDDRADGPRDRARGGGLVCRRPGPGHHLSDRQAADDEPARRRAARPGRRASRCAPFTTSSGRTATCRWRCCAGNCSATGATSTAALR